MPLVKYRIYELSARAVISYGRQQEGAYAFRLSAAETEKSAAPHATSRTSLLSISEISIFTSASVFFILPPQILISTSSISCILPTCNSAAFSDTCHL